MAPRAVPLERQAERTAAVLPPLLVAARRVAATIAQGVHGRRRVGQGEAFWQFRRYEFGDPVQRIDWRQSAKSDPLYVRETEWEAAQSVWLWADGSPSMDFASTRGLPTKRERGDLLALALATLLVRGGERVALLDRAEAPATGTATLHRLALALTRETRAASSLPPARPLPRHAHAVLFGDFLTPLDEIDRVLRGFGAAGIRGHLVHLLDPAEETFPYDGRIRFEGAEREGNLLVRRSEAVRGAYRTALAGHAAGLEAITRSIGWTMTRHRTDHPPEPALLAIHAALGDERQR